ncbi:unnamed protein product [Protopolystoma xenopodis]|uniref:Uncharacterized protein n=1 Tax=Protopolystoma xenopodis TaxID=117903 RepID=A0A3S5BD19_9PLAT|nr:unnamed protein product [Protopolystoma xenopodis]
MNAQIIVRVDKSVPTSGTCQSNGFGFMLPALWDPSFPVVELRLDTFCFFFCICIRLCRLADRQLSWWISLCARSTLLDTSSARWPTFDGLASFPPRIRQLCCTLVSVSASRIHTLD